MNCEKCGTTLEEGVTTCPNCTEAPAASGDVAVATPAKKGGVIAAIIAAIVVVIIVLAVIIGGAPKRKLKKMIEFQYNAKGNVKSVCSLIMPDEIWDVFLEEEGLSKKEYIENMKEEQKEQREELKDDKIKYKYEILDCEKTGKDKIEELNDNVKEYDIKVNKCKEYTVKITEYEDGKKEDSFTRTYYAVKIDGSWYIMGGVFGF